MLLRPNKIKYPATNDGNSIKVDNFSVGTRPDESLYGPTSTTDYWMGISPPISGYTIYKRKDAQGPSMFTPQNDNDLIFFANWGGIGPGGATTATEALYLLDQQTDTFVVNKDYPNVVLSGITFMLDAGYTGSYPRSGTTWRDLSFNGNNALNDLFSSIPSFILSGDGYFFYDKNNFQNRSVISGITNLSAWTIEAWILINYPPDNSSSPSFFSSQYDGTYINFEMCLLGNRVNPPQYNTFTITTFSSGWSYTSGFTYTENIWYHITGTYNGSTLKQYKNGLIQSTLNNVAPTSATTTNTYLMGNPNTSNGFGYLMNAKLYSRALSDSEVLQNYNAHASPLDIITSNLLVQLDAGNILSYPRLTATTWQSMVYSTSNNATLTNGPTFDGGNKGSINFDGTNDYASIPSNFFNPDSGGSFSINIWFKTSTSGGTIFGQKSSSDPSTATSSVPAIYVNSSGNLVISCFSGASVNEIQTSSTSVADGNWHNVVVTFASNTQKTYIDNVLLGSLSKTQVSYSATYYYFVGAGYSTGWPNSNGTYFNGNIGYMSFYNSELSSADVNINYNAIKNRYI